MVTAPLPRNVGHIPVQALAWSLGLSLAAIFTLCVIFDLIFPSVTMQQFWLPLLPGVSWISLPSYLLGIVETVLYGWLVALIFAPLFNFFIERSAK